jgi:hypothetical protein
MLQALFILRCRSHSSGAIVLLTFHILRKQPSSYEPSFSIGHQLKLGALDRLNELFVSLMIENEVGRLASEKCLSLDRLILELVMKVIISVIVKYVEDKMQFCCSHMSHELSQALTISLAAQP